MSNLYDIAAEMRREALAKLGQPIRRKLSRGLHLVLKETARQTQLSLVREMVAPSPREIEIIQRDFEVPASARLEYDQKLTGGKSYYIARLVWPRSAQLALFEETEDQIVMTLKG